MMVSTNRKSASLVRPYQYFCIDKPRVWSMFMARGPVRLRPVDIAILRAG